MSAAVERRSRAVRRARAARARRGPNAWIDTSKSQMLVKRLAAAPLLFLLPVVAALDDGSKPHPWDP